MSGEEKAVTFAFETEGTAQVKSDIDRIQTQIMQLNSILNAYAGIARRLGLPPEADAIVTKIQSVISYLNALRLTLLAIQLASGPVGWALAIAGIGAAAITGYTLVQDLGQEMLGEQI